MKKNRQHTKAEQKTAAEILTQFMFIKNMADFDDVWEKVFKDYNLFHDPFTKCPVTLEDYVELSNEYSRQKMEEKYGYYEL